MHFVEFHAKGHQNIRAMHKTTLEFTKHHELTLDGDCIIAVSADFDANKIKDLVKHCDKVRIKIIAGLLSETVEAIVNKQFNSEDELVVRLGEFDSLRTLGIRADKAAVHLNRTLIEKLRNPNQTIKVRIEAVVLPIQTQNLQ